MAVGIQTPLDVATEFATQVFIIQSILSKVQTATLVKVMAVRNAGEVAAPSTVDVLPLVGQVSGDGQVIRHKTVYGIPYVRMQGGLNAVILDPQVGDLGICVFASRDISAVKAAKDEAPPGSAGMFQYSDGLYIGGVLNAMPQQWVRFSEDGVEIVSPTQVTLRAPSIVLDGPVMGTSAAVFTGDVMGGGISLDTHTHPDPQGGNTGPPNP